MAILLGQRVGQNNWPDSIFLGQYSWPVTHEKEDGNIEFAITDKGIGIPRDELMRIFDKFTVSSKTRTPAEGRGVGLALCEKIIKLHKGKIWAESDGDSGSTFYFVIPMK